MLKTTVFNAEKYMLYIFQRPANNEYICSKNEWINEV